MTSRLHRRLLSTAALSALAASFCATSFDPASAGGFANRQHSTSSLGAAYAGNGAGGDLSSMFWNPAAATVKSGTNSESHYSLIVPHAEVNITSSSNPAFLNAGTNSGDIASLAFVSASYFSHQFTNYDKNLFLAFSFNSPFGLKTKPDNQDYAGSVIGRESKLQTFNLAPTLGYKILPNLSIGVGAQLQYAKAKFGFATTTPASGDTKFEGSGIAAGWTAGILWQSAPSTSIGLGYRSAITQELDGAYINTPATPAGFRTAGATVKLELPDTVTFSVRQSLAQNFRLLGTVEWTNWGVLNELRVVANGNSPAVFNGAFQATIPGQTMAVLPVGWTDGWYFALGGEYDVNQRLTVRAGGAYEITPIDSPTKRLIGIPDNDRIWASLGASYKWSETMTFDIAYSHLFVQDSALDRTSLSGVRMLGNIEASTDIVSVSMKSKW